MHTVYFCNQTGEGRRAMALVSVSTSAEVLSKVIALIVMVLVLPLGRWSRDPITIPKRRYFAILRDRLQIVLLRQRFHLLYPPLADRTSSCSVFRLSISIPRLADTMPKCPSTAIDAAVAASVTSQKLTILNM